MTDAFSNAPNPLGLTSDECLRAYSGAVRLGRLGGRPGALGAYRRLFREGLADIPGFAVEIPPVVAEQRESSPEGEVIKFLTRIGTQGTPRPDPAPVHNPGDLITGTGLGRDVSHRFETLDVESVLIPMIGSSGKPTYTLCVSSQVGCAMGCTFCETGQMGLIRSLTPEEIVAQWWNATHRIGRRPKNIVFMGMGEPMDNLDNVLRAIGVLKDHSGAHVPVSQITVSTVGRVDGIRRLTEHVDQHGWRRLGLALSLNAPNDADRSAIMPVNRKWGLRELQEALLAWPRRSGNKVCIEYVLIPGVNDSAAHADQIADFMRPFGLLASGRVAGTPIMAMLNLIPYNPRRDSPWPAPEEARVGQFLAWLVERGVFVKRRRTKGRQMMGACGQLGSADIRRRRLVTPTISA